MFSWWGERTVGPANWRLALSVIVLSALMLSDPALAQQRDAGWWVVVGSYPSTPPARQQGDLQRVSAAARRCGLRPINDDSAKFAGFRPGLNVFVVGAFASRPEAERTQAIAQRCFPGAYVKQARYLGE
jgi:hypothetical protein